MATIRLRTFANADDVHLVWDQDEEIEGCLGFAIQCRRGDKQPKYLSNRVGFKDDPANPAGGPGLGKKSSQDWPFQRYDWTDHAADLGDVIAYRVVARVLGPDGKLADGPASDWSETLTLSADCGDGVSVHFNRGYVLSQFMARYMAEHHITLAQLKDKVAIVSDQVDAKARAFLGGTLRERMLEIMAETKDDPAAELHGALYELLDEELIDGLVALGPRAQIVLGNGSVDHAGEDENEDARARLNEAGCVVHDRFLAPGGLPHNKFLVIGRKNGNKFAAEQVWTGSTNWTPTGLCTQLNNGILLANDELAKIYERQFVLLAGAGNKRTAELLASNDKETRGIALGSATIDSWFTARTDEADIDELVKLVKGAEKAVLFVMFQPGSEPVKTLLQMQQQKKLYVRGVATQFTGKGQEQFKLLKAQPQTYFLDSVEDTGVGMSVGRWAVEGTAKDFQTSVGHAITHSKVLVIDPLGDHPIVVTGSHNFSASASEKNDENFIVIRDQPEIAIHYAVNAIQTYNHYRWRAYLDECAKKHKSPFDYLSTDAAWQDRRKAGETKRMLEYWMG